MKSLWSSLLENFNLRSTYNLAFFFSLALLAGFQACQKDPNAIGLDLRDRDDLLNAIFTDTVTLTAYSVLEDTLNTRNLSSNLLGFIKDPVFGTTSAGFFAQFVPEGNSVNFGNAPQLDSIVLTLRYTGSFFGDTLNPFVIQVYRLTEDISSTETYYQNKIFAHSSENLTYHNDFHLYPKPSSKVKLDTIVEAHARIRLDDELGKLLLGVPSEMVTNDVFKSFFKGLYVCAKPLANDGSIVSFALTSALTCIQLYYKNDSLTRRFQFPIREKETVRVGNYDHNYNAGNISFINQVVYKDTLLGRELLYVQSMGGIQTKIIFPHIKAFKDKNMVINKAELVITYAGEENSLFPPPNQLNLYRVNNKGENNIPLLDSYTSFWGGRYNTTTKEYRFSITRYLQDVILREDFQPYIYLIANPRAGSASRLILNGTHPVDHSSRLRLELYYTEH